MRTRKTIIILVSGKAGSGKSTATTYLNEKLKEVEGLQVFPYSFANPIKYIAKAFGEWDGEKDEAGREFLQSIGQVFRKYKPAIWVKHLLNQLDKSKSPFPENFVIVDDWRFNNEVTYLKANPLFDVITIRLFGRGGLEGELANDISENDLVDIDAEFIPTGLVGDYLYDYQLDNSIPIEELHSKLDIVLEQIKNQYVLGDE